MIKLEPYEFYKALPVLEAAEINTLFAEAVARNHVSGTIYADQLKDPEVFYICHPYRMSMLCGRYDKPEFNRMLARYLVNEHGGRNYHEWLQTFPAGWNSVLPELLGARLSPQRTGQAYEPDIHELNGMKMLTLEFERINFMFDNHLYGALKKRWVGDDYSVVPTSAAIFEQLSGAVAPNSFWDDADHFENMGVGFSVMQGSVPVSTAFSSCLEGDILEIGVETHAGFRGKGLAVRACIALIDYCLQHGLTPIWSCHGGNAGSIRLAEKLGFQQISNTPYYRVGV